MNLKINVYIHKIIATIHATHLFITSEISSCCHFIIIIIIIIIIILWQEHSIEFVLANF
jgi:hypothetical protein